MRIFHVINSLAIGGAEKMLQDITVKQSKSMKVSIIILNGCSKKTKDFLENSGVNLIELNCYRYNPIIILRLIRVLANADVIHAHLFPSLYWVAITKIFFPNKKYVLTEHNTYNSRRGSKVYWPIELLVYRTFDRIIAISEKAAFNLKEWLPLEGRVIVVNNGIDLSKFSGISQKNKSIVQRLLMVASFTPQKNQDCLIRALNKLPKKFILQLIGDGPRRETLIRLVNDFDLTDRVEFLGQINDVPRYMANSDYIIQSSHWEGFGLVAVEGMAAGKPVLASDVDGLAQVVEGAGVLFKPDDSSDLAEKILYIHKSEGLYDKIAEQSLERSKYYSIDKVVQQYNNVYLNLITG